MLFQTRMTQRSLINSVQRCNESEAAILPNISFVLQTGLERQCWVNEDRVFILGRSIPLSVSDVPAALVLHPSAPRCRRNTLTVCVFSAEQTHTLISDESQVFLQADRICDCTCFCPDDLDGCIRSTAGLLAVCQRPALVHGWNTHRLMLLDLCRRVCKHWVFGFWCLWG